MASLGPNELMAKKLEQCIIHQSKTFPRRTHNFPEQPSKQYIYWCLGLEVASTGILIAALQWQKFSRTKLASLWTPQPCCLLLLYFWFLFIYLFLHFIHLFINQLLFIINSFNYYYYYYYYYYFYFYYYYFIFFFLGGGGGGVASKAFVSHKL